MKRLLIAVPLVMALVAIAVFSAQTTKAQGPPPNLGYHIEVQMLSCINTHKPCNTPSTAPNSLYTNVELDNFSHPGATQGTPDHVNLVCGHAYFDANGFFHTVSQFVSAGFDPGTITGSVKLGGDYSPKTAYAVSTVNNVVATDSVSGDSATVNGKMVINNYRALRVSGGYHLKMTGPIYDSYTNASGQSVITVVGNGTVTCNSYGRYVAAPFASGPYFVSYVGDTPGGQAVHH